MSAWRATIVACHVQRLVHILPQSNPVEESRQDVQDLLKPVWVWKCKESILYIKIAVNIWTYHHKASGPVFAHIHIQPISDHHSHHHVENGWVKWFALHNPPIVLEQGALVETHPVNNGELLPIFAEEAFCFLIQPVSNQYLHSLPGVKFYLCHEKNQKCSHYFGQVLVILNSHIQEQQWWLPRDFFKEIYKYNHYGSYLALLYYFI